MSKRVQTYLVDNVIEIHPSSAYSTTNGLQSAKKRHLLEVTCSLLLDMKVPKPFFYEAVLTD